MAYCLTLLTWVHLEQVIFEHLSRLTSDSAVADRGANGNAHAIHGNHSSKPATKADGKHLSSYRPLTLSDVRPSLFTLYLLQSAFFSTGNIASISSFSLDAVSRLIPVFDPFSQTALLLFKILVPFCILSASLGILNKRLGFAPGAVFMGLIVAGDWLTINFFWMVRDEGSWLEIGETISRFCIVSGLCVFTAALEAGSGVLVGDVDERVDQRHA